MPCELVDLIPHQSRLEGIVDAFVIVGVASLNLEFPDGAFESFGVYTDALGVAVLDVKQIKQLVNVPEPPTLGLLVIGAGLLVLGLRRQAATSTAKIGYAAA